MDKINILLNIIQFACFIGMIYITWLNHIPLTQTFALILFFVILDVLSSYQAKREARKECEKMMEALD